MTENKEDFMKKKSTLLLNSESNNKWERDTLGFGTTKCFDEEKKEKTGLVSQSALVDESIWLEISEFKCSITT